MRINQLFQQFNISGKVFLEVLILVFNSLTWYYMALTILSNVSEILQFTEMELLFLSSVYHIAIIASSFVGSFLFINTRRLFPLYLWMLLGVVAPFLLAFFNLVTLSQVAIAFLFLGVVLGFGLPSCLAYFANQTLVENRGYVGGLVSLITYFSFIPVIITFRMLNVMENFMLTAVWRFFGFALFLFLTRKREITASKTRERKSFFYIIQDKNFFLYLIPWLMFWFVDRSEEFLLRDFLKNSFGLGFYSSSQLILALIVCFFAFVSGVLSDIVGRKRVVTSGFVALGLAYAVISLAPTSLLSWYFWVVADGAAWGTFFTLFILVLWGDLSRHGFREKYYVLGNIPFFLTSVIQLFLAPVVASVAPSSAFSVAAFFLFLAVLPLMYAPETLPERKIRLRQLRSYVEAAKKVREKYLRKSGVD